MLDNLSPLILKLKPNEVILVWESIGKKRNSGRIKITVKSVRDGELISRNTVSVVEHHMDMYNGKVLKFYPKEHTEVVIYVGNQYDREFSEEPRHKQMDFKAPVSRVTQHKIEQSKIKRKERVHKERVKRENVKQEPTPKRITIRQRMINKYVLSDTYIKETTRKTKHERAMLKTKGYMKEKQIKCWSNLSTYEVKVILNGKAHPKLKSLIFF